MKMNSQQFKFMRHSEGNSKREVHSDTGLPKKDRNISNKRPTSMPTRTGGTTTKTAQRKQKKGNKQNHSRIKWQRD